MAHYHRTYQSYGGAREPHEKKCASTRCGVLAPQCADKNLVWGMEQEADAYAGDQYVHGSCQYTGAFG